MVGVLTTYRLDLTADEVVLVGQAIDMLPHGKVARLHNKIQLQIIEQDRARETQASVPAVVAKRKRRNS
jgi:hypothetical protein